MKKMLIVFSIYSLVAMACKKDKEETKVLNDPISSPVADTLGIGTFVGVDHSLAGKVILFKDSTGNHILRLDNFNMTSAPDADIFLSKTQNYVAANILKVYDFSTANYSNSSINIDVNENINFSDYPYVIVWCTQYSAYFGHAPLQ
jgi:hypothetical protein